MTSAPTAGPIAGTGAPVVATDEPTAAPVVGTDAPVASTDAPVASADAPTIAPIVASNAPSFAPSTSPLADGATRAPTEAPKQLVRVQDYFIAYVIDPKADREPTEEEYIEMNVRSAAHFADAIEAFYAGRDDVTFLGVESAIEDTGFQQGIPEERFDIFIDFEFADVAYTLDSTVSSFLYPFCLLCQKKQRSCWTSLTYPHFLFCFKSSLRPPRNYLPL